VETLLEEDSKAIESRLPIANGHYPLLRDIPHCQVNQFESSLISLKSSLTTVGKICWDLITFRKLLFICHQDSTRSRQPEYSR